MLPVKVIGILMKGFPGLYFIIKDLPSVVILIIADQILKDLLFC